MGRMLGAVLTIALVSHSYAVDVFSHWSKTFDAHGAWRVPPVEMFVQSNGDVVICGGVMMDGPLREHPIVLRYNHDGQLLWEHIFDDPTYWDQWSGLFQPDLDGNIYTAISMSWENNVACAKDFALLKISAEGELTWNKFEGLGGLGEFVPLDLKVAPAGDPIVLRLDRDYVSSRRSFTLRKYDGSGEIVWTTSEPILDSFWTVTGEITVDPSSNIYAQLRVGNNVTITKYSPDGAPVWRKPIEWSGPSSIGVAQQPQLYVSTCGIIAVSTLVSDGVRERSVIKGVEPADGHELWSTTLPGLESDTSAITGILGNPDCSFLLVELSRSRTTWTRSLTKVSVGGEVLWSKRLDGPSPQVWGIDIDPSGSIYFNGYSHGGYAISKFTSTGEEQWYHRLPDGFELGGIRAPGNGLTYLCGEIESGSGAVGYITNYQESSCCVGVSGNIDCDLDERVDIADLSTLIDNLYIGFAPLCCHGEADLDHDPYGVVDIADISALIDNLYINFTPIAACQ